MSCTNKCKDCKYFKRESIRASRSGFCYHPRWKGNELFGGDHSYLIGVGTKACNEFKSKATRV